MKLRAISFLLAVLLGGWQTATAAQKTLRGSAHAFSGDTVIVRGAKLRLFGIVAPASNASCQSAAGDWACGKQAEQALADLIDGQELSCRLRHKVGHGYWQASCTLNGQDIAATQVQAGWAKAEPDMTDEYIEQEAQARAAGLGIWRPE